MTDELRQFAQRVLHADTLEDKLWLPEGGIAALTDEAPGEPVQWSEPGRPAELKIASRKDRKKLPALASLDRPDMRVRVLHTFANHELMAVELMAWALLAYPEAGTAFRRGLAHILADEQRHLRLYMDRIEAHGAHFGDLPVNDHFWRCAPSLTTPLKWVSAMNLVFEQANLDFAPVFGEQFERVGDTASAELMKVIEHDEIHHVGFGAHFLKQHTPQGRSSYDVWVENLTFHNSPDRARGTEFNAAARLESGLDEEFVERVRSAASARIA
jgi:uncharacterized ferritin-like protein (DUF455 family)